MPRYGLPLHELPARLGDAVDVAERGQGRTVLLRGEQPVGALVSMVDLDRADPPDPGLGGSDPLRELCGSSRLDWFVDQVLTVYGAARPPEALAPSSAPALSSSPAPSPSPQGAGGRTFFESPLPARPR